MNDDVDYWSMISFEPKLKVTAAPKPAAVSANTCPKCGKALKPRGQHFHIRKCEGPK